MKRYCEPIDGMVAIGVVATLLSGYFMFMAANGVLQAGAPMTATMSTMATGPMAAMQWIEPALGEAVVANGLLELTTASELAAAVKSLNVATLAGQYVEAIPEHIADTMRSVSQMIDGGHQARVQYVLGQSIVSATARGVRTGLVSAVHDDTAFNRRVIQTAAATGDLLGVRFADMRESLLGQMIIAFSQDADQGRSRIQERIGAAVARVTSIQEKASETMGETQAQLGLLTVAAVRGELLSEPFEKADMGGGAPSTPVSFAEERSWPDVPASMLILASIGLIGMFCAGLFMPAAKPEEPVFDEAERAYRKTA
jgi:hypothetical protein